MRFGRYLPLVCVPLAVSMGCGTGSATDRALPEESFDLQAHRGGLGLVTESTIESFTNALQLGVSTLELDTQITEDGIAIVTHDRKVSDSKCVDTGALVPEDPEFPYVGKFVNTLTLAQIRTLDCGALPLTDYPEQRRVPGARMPTLTEVLNLVKSTDAPGGETQRRDQGRGGQPDRDGPARAVRRHGSGNRSRRGHAGQDHRAEFRLGCPHLGPRRRTRGARGGTDNGDFLQVGQDGASPWLGGIDIDDFGGDAIAAIDSFGASAYSPVQGTPQNGKVGDPDFELYVTQDMVNSAHERGIRVIPWTVDDPDTMRALMDLGVDGLITDYPDRLRAVMSERGLSLPEPAR